MFDQAKPSHSLPSSGPKAVESEEPSSSASVISSDLTISKSFDSGGSIEDFRNDEKRRSCPLCGSGEQNEQTEYSLPPWRIVACVECDFVYLANPVDYSDLVEDQAWEKNFIEEAARRRSERPILDRLSKATRWRSRLFGRDKASRVLKVFRKGRVLDVGCSRGTSLPAPLVPFGLEISKHLTETADRTMQKRGGRCIHAAAIEGIKSFDNQFFDGVLLRSFLEHEINPLALLREVHRVLADDGVVYVRVPNYSSINRHVMSRKWCGFRYPDHVNYFTSGSLTKMANMAGFDLQVLRRLTLTFDDNVKAVLKNLTWSRLNSSKNTFSENDSDLLFHGRRRCSEYMLKAVFEVESLNGGGIIPHRSSGRAGIDPCFRQIPLPNRMSHKFPQAALRLDNDFTFRLPVGDQR